MSEQSEIEAEFVRRTRWLLARHGDDFETQTSTGRKVEVFGLSIISELSHQHSKPAFAVYDYAANNEGAVYSELPRAIRCFQDRNHELMARHVERLRPLMILDDIADV